MVDVAASARLQDAETQFRVHCWAVQLKLFRSERLTHSEGRG